MKHCPKCGRSFADDNQKFCTIDGGLLTDQAFDPNATIAAPAAPLPTEPSSAPPPDFSATIATSSSAPTVVLPKNTGPTGSATAANIHQQQQPVIPAAPVPAAPAPPTAAPPVAPTAPAAAAAVLAKKSKLPLVLGILAVL